MVVRPRVTAALAPGIFYALSCVGVGLLWVQGFRAGSPSLAFAIGPVVFFVLTVASAWYVVHVRIEADDVELRKRRLLVGTARAPRGKLRAIRYAASSPGFNNSLVDSLVTAFTTGSSTYAFVADEGPTISVKARWWRESEIRQLAEYLGLPTEGF